MDRDAFRLSSETRVGDGFNPEIALGVAAAINRGEVVRAYRLTGTPALDGGVHKNNVPPVPPQAERTAIGPPETYGFDRESKVLGTQPVGSGSSISEYPFQIIEVDTENVKIGYGTVANIVPTDVNTNVDVSGTDGTWTFWIEVTLDADGLVTAAAVGYATTGLPTDDSDTAYLLIGEVEVSSSVITSVSQAVMFSMGFVACGRDAADTATTPGTYYFFVGSSSNAPGGPPPP